MKNITPKEIENIHQNSVNMILEGNTYVTYSDSALVLSCLVEDICYIKIEGNTCSFPRDELFEITDILIRNNVNYTVTDYNRLEEMYKSDNNAYSKYKKRKYEELEFIDRCKMINN